VSVHIDAIFLKHINARHNEEDRNANDLFLTTFSASGNLDGSNGISVRVA